MPQMNIPALGSTVVLAQPWTFDVYNEFRNVSLLDALKLIPPATGKHQWSFSRINRTEYGKIAGQCTLVVGTELTIDRIYIRQGAPDYDSVTLRCNHPTKKGRRVRFWVKLKDFNQIQYQ